MVLRALAGAPAPARGDANCALPSGEGDLRETFAGWGPSWLLESDIFALQSFAEFVQMLGWWLGDATASQRSS